MPKITNDDMHDVKIYQIDKAFDKYNVKGLSLTDTFLRCGVLDERIYKEVLNIKMPTDNIYDIYSKFVDEKDFHPLYRGESFKTSDVLIIDNCAYYKNPDEFIRVAFKESLTHKENNLLDVIYVEPNLPAYKAEVRNELEDIQKAVKGCFQIVYNSDDTLIVCNDEAKILNMDGNRHIEGGGVIAGPFFVTAEKEDDFSSLSKEEQEKYLEKYETPENISQMEVQNDMGFSFYVGSIEDYMSPMSFSDM